MFSDPEMRVTVTWTALCPSFAENELSLRKWVDGSIRTIDGRLVHPDDAAGRNLDSGELGGSRRLESRPGR
jgi:hypothetical protein